MRSRSRLRAERLAKGGILGVGVGLWIQLHRRSLDVVRFGFRLAVVPGPGVSTGMQARSIQPVHPASGG